SVKMRLLTGGEEVTNGSFTLTQVAGGEGAWAGPHIHRQTQEAFFVLEGEVTLTVGEQIVPLGPRPYLLVPPGARRMIHAGTGGGRLLTLMVPGGLEEMFFELASLPPGGITDPAVRAEISSRYDSVPT